MNTNDKTNISQTIGIISKIYGTVYNISKLPDYSCNYTATVRGNLRFLPKRQQFLQRRHLLTIGDEVFFQVSNPKQAVIVGIKERINELTRSLEHTTHDLAANVDQVFILTSLESITINKRPKLNFLDRVLSSAISQQIAPVIIFSKVDLLNSTQQQVAKQLLQPYYDNYPHSFAVNLLDYESISKILQLITGRRTILVGQSGSGKSTLTNSILRRDVQKTQTVNQKTKKGFHTTSNSSIFVTNHKQQLHAWIDSPGIREWGLAHLSAHEIVQTFPEFAHNYDYLLDYDFLKKNPKALKEAITATVANLKSQKSMRAHSLAQILTSTHIPNQLNPYAHRRQLREIQKNTTSNRGKSHYKWKNIRSNRDKSFQASKNMW